MPVTSKYLSISNWIWPVLLLLCLVDLGYSAYQHYHTKLEGDIASIVVPKTEYREVLADPFGVAAVLEGKRYAGTARFFCHYSMKLYFSEAPLFLGRFTDKINALYWSSATFKILVQLLLLLIMGLYAHSLAPLRMGSYILLLFLLTPFFQTTGYSHVLAIINPSITYVFFYSWPVAMLLLFYYPFFISYMRQRPPQISVLSGVGLALLVVFLPFSSPVNAPVILLLTLLYLSDLSLRFWHDRPLQKNKVHQWFSEHVHPTTFIYFGTISVLALYATYLGQFNTENSTEVVTLGERYYPRLLNGLQYMLTIKLGYPVLLGALFISWYLLKKTNKKDSRQIRKLAQWAIVFFFLYTALLPLGGYRSYRPGIARTDTMLPVICGLVILYGIFALYLLRTLPPTRKKAFALLLLAVAIIFSAADDPNFDHNATERAGLQQLMRSEADTVVFSKEQLVLSWDKLEKPEDSRWNAILLQRWGITDTIRLYYNRKD